MSDDPFPRDALFIKWGRFQAGASGRLAIVALLVIVVIFGGHALGLWSVFAPTVVERAGLADD